MRDRVIFFLNPLNASKVIRTILIFIYKFPTDIQLLITSNHYLCILE